MSNIQILIENIRKSVNFPESVTPEQIQVYARRYTESCTELNRRMMQCIQQIRAGNITEGVRLAELKPNLTEMYLSLDIPERDEWNEIVATLGFDVPQPLPVELSRELNEAYMKLAPLEPLLRWHRLYALNRSSIRERLAMIRSIAKKDRENIYWSEDQEKFEKARIKELGKEIQQAIETKNFQQIVSLHAELNASDWIHQPPPDFRWRLSAVVLQNEADSLMEKFSAFEYDEASNIYARMEQIAALEKMAIPPAIRQLIRPAVQWLNEMKRQHALQQEFHRAAAELRTTLEYATPLPELERLHDLLGTAAYQAGMDIPEDLEELYRTEVKRLHFSARMKNLLALGMHVAACLLLCALLCLGWYWYEKDKRGKQEIAATEQFERETSKSNDPVKDLREKCDRRDKAILAADIFQKDRNQCREIMNRVKLLIDVFADREEEFQTSLAEAKRLLDDPEQPSALATAQEHLDQAKEYARTKAENEEHENGQVLLVKLQKEFDARFRKEQLELRNEYNTIHNNPDLFSTEALERLVEIDNEFKKLQSEYSGKISPPVTSIGNQFAGDIKEELEFRSTMQSLRFDWTEYPSALQKLVTKFPDRPVVKVTGAADVWNGMGEIREVAESLREFATFYTKAVDSGTFQQEFVSLKKKYDKAFSRISGTSNEIFMSDDVRKTFSKMNTYISGDFATVENYLEILSHDEYFPWIEESSQNNKWYYLTTLPDRPGDYDFVKTFGDEEIPENQFVTIEQRQLRSTQIPQTTPDRFAKAALEKIRGINGNAVTTVKEIMDDLFERKGDDQGIDPIIQCIVMDLLISDMSKIDPFFEENFAELKQIIQEPNINQYNTNWMDIGETTVDNRATARNAISNCSKKIPLAFDNTRRDRTEFRDRCMQFHPQFEWLGILIKNDKKWECVAKQGVINSKAGDLYIFCPGANQTVELVRIGQVSSGKFELRGNEPSLLQCAPVFLVQQ